MDKTNNEFYIGWQPQAPGMIIRRVRRVLLIVLVLVPLIGSLVVLNQTGFATSRFEYGIPTSISGVFMTSPAPLIRLFRGVDVAGDSVYQHILLVGPGKRGVNEILRRFEKEHGYILEGRQVQVTGYLIYHDGKALIEFENMKDVTEEGQSRETIQLQPHGRGNIVGEITDPKCLFGVMKPGYGKPHRSCAARCIAGGIPPVLKTVAMDGEVLYYILEGETKGAINQEVQPVVGDQVAVCGEIYRMGEWMILKKDPTRKISLFQKGPGKATSHCN